VTYIRVQQINSELNVLWDLIRIDWDIVVCYCCDLMPVTHCPTIPVNMSPEKRRDLNKIVHPKIKISP